MIELPKYSGKRMDPYKKNPIQEVFGVSHIMRPPRAENEPEPEIICTEPEVCGTWEQVEAVVSVCTKCPLWTGRKNVVFGEGDKNAELMFIGEGPGQDEDDTGRPFVGAAGQLLTKMIEAMGLKREQVYIANIVKCRPPNNRAPFKEEASVCIDYLYRQIELVKPKIIIALGSVAVQNLLDTNTGITRLRGEFVDYKGIKLMPTFHPSYLLRSPKMKKPAWEDLQTVMKEMGLQIK